MSAIKGAAGLPSLATKCPLMTQSEHLAGVTWGKPD
jgi:hypothetical protein